MLNGHPESSNRQRWGLDARDPLPPAARNAKTTFTGAKQHQPSPPAGFRRPGAGELPTSCSHCATLNITTSAFAVKRFVFATDIFALSFPSIKFPAEILPFRERQASSLARDIDHVCRDLAISYANRAQNGCRRIPGKLTMRRLPLTPMSPIVERPSFLELANSLLTVLHRTGNLTG